jgi:hypothetical protein
MFHIEMRYKVQEAMNIFNCWNYVTTDHINTLSCDTYQESAMLENGGKPYDGVADGKEELCL